MSERWVISDTHIGHKNILKYQEKERAFQSIEEHDDTLIRNWNNVVRPKDVVYLLGDVIFQRTKFPDLDRLNGQVTLILGNHDYHGAMAYMRYFHDIRAYVTPIKGMRGIVFTHVPIHPHCLEDRWTMNVHGHLHSHTIKQEDRETKDVRYFNVSAEHTDLKPLNFDVVIEYARYWGLDKRGES